ncbi:MAG: NADH oxidase [Peptoniphilus lacrimalis]
MELNNKIYSPQTAREKTNFSIIMSLGINNLYEASELIDNGICNFVGIGKADLKREFVV